MPSVSVLFVAGIKPYQSFVNDILSTENDPRFQLKLLREQEWLRAYRDKFRNRNDDRNALRRMLKAAKPENTIITYKNDVIFGSALRRVQIGYFRVMMSGSTSSCGRTKRTAGIYTDI